VLPGTGGLTRLVDKRKVRRDLADVFCTLAEGVRGKRAKVWGLVDAVYPRSKFDEGVRARAEASRGGAPRRRARRRSCPARREALGRGRAHGPTTATSRS
jgi:benzoyl-CoA-dihydrodiol lyase